MARWFVGLIPVEAGEFQIVPNGERSKLEITRRGPRFTIRRSENLRTGRHDKHGAAGISLGRVPEGWKGTTGRPHLVYCTGNATVFQHLKDLAAGDANYDWKTLRNAWQLPVWRNRLKANGMPWLPGEFGPDPGSTYGRPTLPVVYCGQGHDVFAPEVP